MDDIVEEEQKKEEKKAFYTGLATVAGVILIIALTIFFVRGCSDEDQTLEEAKDSGSEPEASQALSTPQAAAGSVAGTETEPSPTSAVQGKTYTVENGDTLFEIGQKFKVDWRKIAEINGIDNAAALKVGKEIIIPTE